MPENCPVTPLTQSEVVKNPRITNLNYTAQEYWSLKSRIIDLVKAKFGPTGSELPNTFNDLVEGSIFIMLMEVVAFVGDTLSFKIDQIANEVFIDTVTEKDNIFRLAKLVGFNPTPPIAAKSSWIASLNNVLTNDAILLAPVIIDIVTSDGESIVVELFPADSDGNPIFDEDIVIPAGNVSNSSIIGLEGVTTVDSIRGTGESNYSSQLQEGPVILDSIRVNIDGVEWDRVDFFSDSQPRREFRVEYDANFNAFIVFGNGKAGMIPSRGSVIQITYRVGGGVRGNITTGYVTTQKQAPVPGLSVSVPVTLTNYTRGYNGYNGDTLDDVRNKLPVYLNTQNRGVSGSDIQTLTEQFATPYNGEIGRATAVLRNSGCAGNILDLYVLARDGNDLIEASPQLKAELNDELQDKKMLGQNICIKNGVIIYTDIVVEAICDRSQRKFENEIKENILNRVNGFFLLENWAFNQDLKVQDLIKELSDIKQVKSYEITFNTNDPNNSGVFVNAGFNEIIRPDTITVTAIFE